MKEFARGFSIVGAVCFIIMVVLEIVHQGLYVIDASLHYGYEFAYIYVCSNSIRYILLFFGYIVTAIALIKGNKNILFPIGTALIAIANVLYIISHSDYFFGLCFKSISNFIVIFPRILTCFGIIYIFVIAIFTYFSTLSGKNNIIKKLWFIPAIILAVYANIQFFRMVGDPYVGVNLYSLLNYSNMILSVVAFGGLGLWMASDYEAYKSDEERKYYKCFASADFNLAIHIILLCLFGMWQYFWVYRTTKKLNADKSVEYRSPAKKLLLYMFVPYYSIYWVHISCQRIDNLAKQRGLTSNISALCVVFSVFMPFVAWIVMQSKINKICKIQPVYTNVNSSNDNTDFKIL